MLLPKGSKLICPNCENEIIKIKVDVSENHRLLALEVEGLNGYEPKAGEPVICPKCQNIVNLKNLDNYKKSDN